MNLIGKIKGKIPAELDSNGVWHAKDELIQKSLQLFYNPKNPTGLAAIMPFGYIALAEAAKVLKGKVEYTTDYYKEARPDDKNAVDVFIGPSSKPKEGKKSLPTTLKSSPFLNYPTKKFTGVKKDILGRQRCWQEGIPVPCNKLTATGGQGEKEPVRQESLSHKIHDATKPANPKKLELNTKVEGWLNESGEYLSHERKNHYHQAITSIIEKMNNKCIELLNENIDTIRFHENTDELTEYVKGLEALEGKTLKYDKYGGIYDGANKELDLSGGITDDTTERVYSHELSHALDNDYKFSKTREWFLAWEFEVNLPGGPVSNHARENQIEGFAEFGSLVFTNPTKARFFKKCYKFWIDNGLITSEPEATKSLFKYETKDGEGVATAGVYPDPKTESPKPKEVISPKNTQVPVTTAQKEDKKPKKQETIELPAGENKPRVGTHNAGTQEYKPSKVPSSPFLESATTPKISRVKVVDKPIDERDTKVNNKKKKEAVIKQESKVPKLSGEDEEYLESEKDYYVGHGNKLRENFDKAISESGLDIDRGNLEKIWQKVKSGFESELIERIHHESMVDLTNPEDIVSNALNEASKILNKQISTWKRTHKEEVIEERELNQKEQKVNEVRIKELDLLKTSKISSIIPLSEEKEIGETGKNGAHMVKFNNGNKAIFKPASGEVNLQFADRQGTVFYTREVAASNLATKFGFGDLIPPTIERNIDIEGSEEYGSLQAFVPNLKIARKLWDKGGNIFDGRKDLARAALFDFLTGNRDRHPGNCGLVKQGNWFNRNITNNLLGGREKLVLIDNGLSFGENNGKYYTLLNNYRDSHFLYLNQAAKERLVIPEEVKNWKWGEIEKSLRDANLEEPAIKATKERFLTLKKLAGKSFEHIFSSNLRLF